MTELRGPLNTRMRRYRDRKGPQHPESTEAAAINAIVSREKDDWLWAYPDESDELDPTRPSTWELLADTELGQGK